MRKTYRVEIPLRDLLEVDLEIDGGQMKTSQFRVLGCSEFLELVESWKTHFQGEIKDLPLPQGRDHSSLLLKELILKIKNEWEVPYPHEELCHCRQVSTEKIGEAIVCGAHSVEKVARDTSAGTGCGTCRGDIQKLIDHRLEK